MATFFAQFTVAAFGLLPVSAQDISGLPIHLQSKVEAAKAACTAIEGGEFTLEWGTIQRTDLNGDLHADWVLNEFGFSCSSAVSLYCGTGGCMSHFLVGETLKSLLNKG